MRHLRTCTVVDFAAMVVNKSTPRLAFRRSAAIALILNAFRRSEFEIALILNALRRSEFEIALILNAFVGLNLK